MRAPLPITRRRRLALLIGGPLALFTIGYGALTAVAWAGQGSYPVRLNVPVHGRTVAVAVDSGQVSLHRAAGRLVQVTGTARYAVIRSRVTWRYRPSGVSVDSRCRFLTGPCEFDFSVGVPAGLHAVISNGSGDVTARALSGQVTVVNDSGDVRVIALSGSVSIKDQSGEVTGNLLSGQRLVISNGSGDVVISGLTSQDVAVSAQSGDITLIFAQVPRVVRVSDQSGNIRLVLPRGGTAYRVSASTSSGQSTIAVPTSPSSPYLIIVTNQSGDISITH